jgi:hypothetical protein
MPSSVLVGPFRYRITTDVSQTPTPGGQDNYAGRSHHTESVIFIRPDGSLAKRQEVLLHELMHCAVHLSGTDHLLADLAAAKPDETEEQLISVTAPNLLMILQQNPSVLTWLTLATEEDDEP